MAATTGSLVVAVILIARPASSRLAVGPAPGLAVAGPPDQVCLSGVDAVDCDNIGSDHEAVALADLDGDGFDELAWAGLPNRLCRGQLGAGAACESVSEIPDSGLALAVGDIDGDGRFGFVISTTAHGFWDCTLDVGAGAGFHCSQLPLPDVEGRRIVVGDVNGDGAADIVASPSRGPPVLCSRSMGGPFTCKGIADGGDVVMDLAIADLDHDKVDDLLVAWRSGGLGRICWGGKPLSCEAVPAEAAGSSAVAAYARGSEAEAVFATHAGTLVGCDVSGRLLACGHELRDVGTVRGLALGDVDGDRIVDVGIVSTEKVLLCPGTDPNGTWCAAVRELSDHGGLRVAVGRLDPGWPTWVEPTPSATASSTPRAQTTPSATPTDMSPGPTPRPPVPVLLAELDRIAEPIPVRLDGLPLELSLSLARDGPLLWALGGGCYSKPSVPQQVRCDSRLVAIDVSDPGDLQVVSEFRFEDTTEATDLAVHDAVAYVWVRRFPVSVGVPEGRLMTLDIGKPAEVRVIQEMEVTPHTRYNPSLATKGSTLYLGSPAGLSLLDLAVAGRPVVTGLLPGPAVELGIVGEILYAAAGLYRALKVYDATDAQHPALLSEVPLSGDARSIRGDGEHLVTIEAALCGSPSQGYQPCGDIAHAFAATDPKAVTILGSLTGAAHMRVYSTGITGPYALCGTKALQAFDLRAAHLDEAGSYSIFYSVDGATVPASVVGLDAGNDLAFAFFLTSEAILLSSIRLGPATNTIFLPLATDRR